MTKFFTLFITVITSYTLASAKNKRPELAVNLIADTLKKNANAVIRYSERDVVFEKLNKVIVKERYAVTVLNKEGKMFGKLNEMYSTLLQINGISGYLLDEHGEELAKLKNNDILDVSTFGMSSAFHSDHRIKFHAFNYAKYPYTVVYEIDATYKTTFLLPRWTCQPSGECAIENASLLIQYPEEFSVREKEFLMPLQTQRETLHNKGMTTKKWLLKNILASDTELYLPKANYARPTLELVCDNFDLLSKSGNMSNWLQFGKFIYELNANRDLLTDAKVLEVKKLIANESSQLGIIQKLYTHMQQTTRYVGIQYGIAGWQTFDAKSVVETGYGDCKGLTNYLKAMLQVAGIKSYSALVSAGDDFYNIDESFTNNYFNHVILCVPQLKDTIWIECTSQTLNAGYLGDFTQNRQALLVTENGGFLCSTPSYGKNENKITRRALIKYDHKQEAQHILFKNYYNGTLQDDLASYIRTNSENKVKEMVNSKLPIASYDTKSYSYKHLLKGNIPYIEENIDAVVSGLSSGTRKRFFLNVNWMPNPMKKMSQTKERVQPFALNNSFCIADSVEIQFSDDLTIEFLPDAKEINYPFAKFSYKYVRNGSNIHFVRNYEQFEGIYDASDFKKYQELYYAINAGKDQSTIVLLNNNEE